MLLMILETHKRVFGEKHHWTLHYLCNLGELYTEWARYDEALSLLAEVVADERQMETERAVLCHCLIRYSACLGKLQRYDEAEAALLEGCQILTRILGADHRETLDCRVNVGDLYIEMGRYDEAEAALLEAHEILSVSQYHKQTVDAVNAIVELFYYEKESLNDRNAYGYQSIQWVSE